MKRFSPEAMLATFFGVGKFPFMPGTIASAVATILVALLFYQPHMVERDGVNYLEMGAVLISPDYIIHVLIGLAAFFYFAGVWAAENYSKGVGIKDPSSVVIDEVAGVFTAFSLIATVYAGLLAFSEQEYLIYLIMSYLCFPVVFIFFRIFDIFKPWHVGRADRKYEGGFGIMIDDIIAGAYTAIAFYIVFFAAKYSGYLDRLIAVE